jgi:Mg-chelatase subunit ChlD
MGRTYQTACRSTGDRATRRTAAYQAYAQQRQAQAQAQGREELTEEELATAAPVDVIYDVSYDSSFYAHYFTAQATTTDMLIPSFGVATTINPLENGDQTVENWLSVNLNSCFDGQGIRSNNVRLQLVITLDVSGSMADRFEGEPGKTKIQIAQQSLLTLLKQLSPDDALGIVLFNGTATVLHPIEKLSSINKEKLEEDILKLRAGGETNITKAVKCATDLYHTRENNKDDNHNISRRIFFLTDMEVSHEDGQEFLKHIKDNAENERIWTTVVGVGLDLGKEVIQSVSKTIGCNYCNVRNARTFDQLMNTQFHYTVTPVGFNIQFQLMGERYRIGQGYGSPEVYEFQDPITPRQSIKLVSEFALPMNDQNEVRGGYLLFQMIDLKKDQNDQSFRINTSWDNLEGITQTNEQDLQFSKELDSFTHSGIRKAILLVRYTKFIKRYLKVRQASATPDIMDEYQTMRRQFPRLVEYFHKEMLILNDRSLYEEEYRHLLDIAQKDDIPLNQYLRQPQTITAPTTNTATSTIVDVVTDDTSTMATTTGDRCCICLSNKSSVILFSCGHKCLCNDCADQQQEQLTRCPLCRQDVMHSQ